MVFGQQVFGKEAFKASLENYPHQVCNVPEPVSWTTAGDIQVVNVSDLREESQFMAREVPTVGPEYA